MNIDEEPEVVTITNEGKVGQEQEWERYSGLVKVDKVDPKVVLRQLPCKRNSPMRAL